MKTKVSNLKGMAMSSSGIQEYGGRQNQESYQELLIKSAKFVAIVGRSS